MQLVECLRRTTVGRFTLSVTCPFGSIKASSSGCRGHRDPASPRCLESSAAWTNRRLARTATQVRPSRLTATMPWLVCGATSSVSCSRTFNLLEWASARENVELPATYTDIAGKPRRRRARELLESVGAGQRSERLPAEMSGGEQQRVAIARALTNGARTILADEPTGALDSQGGDAVMRLLADLARHGRTVVVASHDSVAARYATRRIVLRGGRIASDTRTADRSRSVPAPASRDRSSPARASRSIGTAFGAALARCDTPCCAPPSACSA